MTTEYTDVAGESEETIGDVLNGTGSVEGTLMRLAEFVGRVSGQLESERDLRNEVASAFVNALESFVVSISAATDALAAFESEAKGRISDIHDVGQGMEGFVARLTSFLNLMTESQATSANQQQSPGGSDLAYAGLKQPQAPTQAMESSRESQQYSSQLTGIAAPEALGSFGAQGVLWELLSPMMDRILQGLEQRFAETARFMDDTVSAVTSEERHGSFSKNVGFPATAPDRAEGLALVHVDELNEAVTQFISALGRIEQTMEKATDIRVTVSAGDGWD